MEKNPFFSVCIPNFNHEYFVGQTIQSVLDQSFTDLEVIVVDNYSTDNSWEVIQSYAKKDTRVKIFRNKINIGFAPNLQRATEKASGQYIILLSSDDLMYIDALASYKKVIDLYGQSEILIHCPWNYIDPQNKITQVGLRYLSDNKDYFTTNANPDRLKANWIDGTLVEVPGIDALRASLITGKSPSHFMNLCYPRSLWQAVEGYDPKYLSGPDTSFLYKLLATGAPLVYLRKVLFGYRIHGINQLSLDRKSGILKKQVDKYVLSFSLDAETLNKTGITRTNMESLFISVFCLNESISCLSEGFWSRAFKVYAFGLATYPQHVFSNLKGYLIPLMLLLGPISTTILKAWKSIKK